MVVGILARSNRALEVIDSPQRYLPLLVKLLKDDGNGIMPLLPVAKPEKNSAGSMEHCIVALDDAPLIIMFPNGLLRLLNIVRCLIQLFLCEYFIRLDLHKVPLFDAIGDAHARLILSFAT